MSDRGKTVLAVIGVVVLLALWVWAARTCTGCAV